MENQTMNYEQAQAAMRLGAKVRRQGWGDEAKHLIFTDDFGGLVMVVADGSNRNLRPSIQSAANGTRYVPWNAEVGDLTAEDWASVDPSQPSAIEMLPAGDADTDTGGALAQIEATRTDVDTLTSLPPSTGEATEHTADAETNSHPAEEPEQESEDEPVEESKDTPDPEAAGEEEAKA